MKIKEHCDSLGSISVNVDDDEMVQICLGGLTPRFSAMRTVVLAREKPPSFFDLQSMLLVEENHVRTRSNASEGHMLYTHSKGGRGCGRARGRFGQGRGGRGGVRNSTTTEKELVLKEGLVLLLGTILKTEKD